MKIKKAYLGMIKAFPGGWDAMCGALGMSFDALQNRVYERRGQGVLVDTALQLQAFSATTLFAEAVAASSGGTFVKLPTLMFDSNEMLAKKFRKVYVAIGTYADVFEKATADELIDKHERANLEAVADDMHRAVAELLSLTLAVYCPSKDKDGAE